MSKSRLSKEFELGVDNFIKFGFFNTNNTSIRCLCLKCGNCQRHKGNDIKDHLYFNGIDESYKIWFWHGEENFQIHHSMENPLSVCMKRMMLEI